MLGCSYQKGVVFGPSDLPEAIYVSPDHKHYRPLRVGVFQFTSPSHAPLTGKAAAHSLYVNLLRQNVFAEIAFESDTIADQRSITNTDIARKYDLIIIGNLLHYFDGGDFHTSHVEEDFSAVKRVGDRTEVLLYARALSVGSPIPSADYILLRTPTLPAPSGSVLMERNAAKFSNLVRAAFSQ